MFWMFFEELRFFGVRQLILWVILLWMHIFSALYDPCGSLYDEVPYVWCRQGQYVWCRQGQYALSCPFVDICLCSYLFRDRITSRSRSGSRFRSRSGSRFVSRSRSRSRSSSRSRSRSRYRQAAAPTPPFDRIQKTCIRIPIRLSCFCFDVGS